MSINTLIFLAIVAVITIIQKKLEKSKEEQRKLPPQQMEQDNTEEHRAQPPRSLQDLIRQFENAQRQAGQGNIEPAVPPVAHPPLHTDGPLTLRDVAEEVIDEDAIDLEFLMGTFDVDEDEAADMIIDLQRHRIIGRNMGEGMYDVLVHDKDELDNLLNHEIRAESEQQEELELRKEQESAREQEEAHRLELERQQKLNELEERAKAARENAASPTTTVILGDETSSKQRRAPLVSTRNLADVRKGFIWAKVLDEPRFKRRWSTQYR